MIDQAQLAKAHRALDQRVRADHEVNGSAGELRLQLAALLCGSGAGEKRDPKARGLEQPPDVDVMLLGEDLGRRHERDLEAVLHRHQGGHQRNDCLAGADVPLEQPVHRDRPLHVFHDFRNHLLLIAGQFERKHPPRRFADRIGDYYGARLPVFLSTALAQHQPQLKEEELFEDHPLLRGRAEPIEGLD